MTNMKLHILSDLHNEFSKFVPPKTAADVVVLAGDIDNHRSGVYWAAATFDKPVIYIAGNHEYYHDNTKTLPAELGAAAEGTSVHFLDNNSPSSKACASSDRRYGPISSWDHQAAGKSRNQNIVPRA